MDEPGSYYYQSTYMPIQNSAAKVCKLLFLI